MAVKLQIDEELNSAAQVVRDENGKTSSLALSTNFVGIGTSNPEGAVGMQPYSADRLLDIHKPDWVRGDDIQLRVGDLILDSRNNGSNNIEADAERGTLGNLCLLAKGLIAFFTKDTPTSFSEKVRITNNGNVGIGTRRPQQKLEVNGNILATGDVQLSGADCAEEFRIKESSLLDPGTVMVIGDEETLHHSTEAYDRKVAGIISGAGDLKPGIVLGRQSTDHKRMPLALSGKVFCNADATYSPIETGDLLTTSPTPGYAMKASDPLKAFGAVLGKALRPLNEGQGLIPVLITLH